MRGANGKEEELEKTVRIEEKTLLLLQRRRRNYRVPARYLRRNCKSVYCLGAVDVFPIAHVFN